MVSNCALPLLTLFILISTGSYAVTVHKPNKQDIVKQLTRTEGEIKFDSRVQDFGEVNRGDILTHRFHFANIGKGDSIIQAVHTPCGCTTVEFVKGKVYLSQDEGFLDVSFDTTDFSGKISKSFTVLTSASRNKVKTLVLKADVKSAIEVSPPLVDFGNLRVGETAERRVLIKPTDGGDLNILDVDEKSNFDIAIKKQGELWHMDIRMKSIKSGILREMVTIRTDHKTLSHIPLPVVANVEGNVSFEPVYLDFGSVEKRKKSNKNIVFSSEKDFSIKSFDINMYINGLKVDAKKFISLDPHKDPQKKGKLSLSINNPEGWQGSVAGDIQLTTDLPHEEDLRIEFYAFFKE